MVKIEIVIKEHEELILDEQKWILKREERKWKLNQWKLRSIHEELENIKVINKTPRYRNFKKHNDWLFVNSIYEGF